MAKIVWQNVGQVLSFYALGSQTYELQDSVCCGYVDTINQKQFFITRFIDPYLPVLV